MNNKMSVLKPYLNPGSYVFCSITERLPQDVQPICMFQETEGTTYVIKSKEAEEYNLKFENKWKWISLGLQSELESVGLTAIFSKALAEANIPCNVIAAYYHDHIFVPENDALKAMSILEKIII